MLLLKVAMQLAFCTKNIFQTLSVCVPRRTVSLCRQAAHAGASFITVHGRTPQQRAQPVNTDAIRTIKDSVQVPVIANGDLCTLGDCESVREATGVDGRGTCQL